MTNEHYLYVSYALDGLFTIGLSLCVCRWLYRSHERLVDAVAVKPWTTVLKRAFPFGIILPALIGFLAVSYTATGCGDRDYKSIVADREYLIAKSHEQISGALNWTALAVFAWGILVVLILATSPAFPSKTKASQEGRLNESSDRGL